MIIDCSIESISYGSNTVLENVYFKVYTGECLLISGDSGSGKSTVLHFISGLLEKKHAKVNGICNIKKGTSLVFIAQNPDSNIISNDVKSELLLYSCADIAKINSIILTYSIPESFLNRKTNELSGGQKQLLAVLCGIIQDADLYVLDEPTAMLDDENTLIVTEIIKELLENKKTVIITTHNKVQFSFGNKHLELNSKPKKHQVELFCSEGVDDEKICLRLNDICFSYRKNEVIFKDFNLSLINGDILLLTGKNGTGKTTLAKLMSGLLKPQKGVILFNEKMIRKTPRYLPVVFSYSLQNPNWQLLFESVDKEIKYSINTLSQSNTNSRRLTLDLLLENTIINKEKEPRDLSFGQKKFITNFSFFHNPSIHFFDEPDLGTDEVFNNYFIDYLLFRKNKGLISIVVSHNLEKYKHIANKHITLL